MCFKIKTKTMRALKIIIWILTVIIIALVLWHLWCFDEGFISNVLPVKIGISLIPTIMIGVAGYVLGLIADS